ncbi:methyl-accepting chemotaxis protein [Rhodoferax sp.]|uniref:methyl-accepting chemotaxis protein n=1 Tax=Rhodoferax sp. TaxID=50421 RepID=UPI00283D4C7E|nr:methyl-accepting chemotaxis protein [Rhodoferax sp.]MDR3368218.1 methyl-accepting chemotaxis protein [Rhodoferax sp.]
MSPQSPVSALSGDSHQLETFSADFFKYHGFWAPGVRLFRALRFSTKAIVISLTLVLPTLCLLIWQLMADANWQQQARMDATRGHVEIAYGVLTWAQAQELAGTLTREQAQQQARLMLSKMRYDGNEYFWINDMQQHMVMHGASPELDGKDMSGMKDPNGLALFGAFVDTVRRDGKGFVRYQWPRPGTTQPVDKLSYVQGFEPWGWVLGSGIYVEDLNQQWVHQLVLDTFIVLISMLVAVYLFLSFYRVMDGGLKETRRHLHAMTAGDLTTSPSPWGHDEAARLMLDLRQMQNSLRDMVLRVRHSSDEIVHSSAEIASGAMDLSARTEQAAANLEESAASMEEISSTVKITSDHTAEAARVAQNNAETAAQGGRVMREVVQTMENIRGSSARIGEIIGTIDGIAFQTNILALNAAVEAARAGEQGRGFAVVASEVRSLAQRSAAAAREIKTLIGTSVEQVESGSNIVQKAGDTIEDIVQSSHRVSGLLSEIATGAREQSLGIGQIGQSVQDLDRMTQQNAALVEETAAASSAMKDQANTLADEVARFQLPAGAAMASTELAVASVANFNFDNAIEAHRAWKVRLRKAIADKGHLDAEILCRDDKCPLGQWLHGEGGQQWGSKPNFVTLLDKHAQFHQVAGGVAKQINQGQYALAEKLIGSGSDFAQVSTEVATLLTKAKRGM